MKKIWKKFEKKKNVCLVSKTPSNHKSCAFSKSYTKSLFYVTKSVVDFRGLSYKYTRAKLHLKTATEQSLRNKERKLTHSVWKSQKKSYSTLRAKRATFTFWSLLIWQKMVENVKIQNFKCDILSNFQTMCNLLKMSQMTSFNTF